MKRLVNILAVIFIMNILWGCSSTKVTATWKADDFSSKSFNKILVIGLTSKKNARSTFEYNLVDQMEEEGYNAYPSISVLLLKKKPTEEDKEKLRSLLLSDGYDAVITISLLDVNESTHYVPGSSYYIPGSYYNRFGPYYYNNYYRVHEPGYYTKSVKVFLETNLYDLSDGALVWSAQSETVDPANPEKMADEYAIALVRELVIQKILK